MSEEFDVLIIGAGVVGLATGIALIESRPELRVCIADKEEGLGSHASGRNSGVLHAGFYYSPESLKARFCRDGNIEMKLLCKEYDIPLLNCGKIVVTQNESEELRLEEFLRKGELNGVDLEIHDINKLKKYEPLAKTFGRFLWSPNTSVSDPKEIIKAMYKKFIRLGGEVKLSQKIDLKVKDSEILADVKFKHLVNCAGAQADAIAKKVGEGLDYAMLPFMGIYRFTTSKKLPLKTLVYPVPHPINPFLGVHFTLTTSNKIKIGPTAIPIFGREQYKFSSGWNSSDFFQSLKAAKSIVLNDKHDLSRIIQTEIPKFFFKNLLAEGARLVPKASEIVGWQKLAPGIRAQLVHLPSGGLEQDFVVRQHMNATHILNAVSPGWTSALPFGRYLAEKYILPKVA